MPDPITIGTAIGTCVACKATETLLKKGAITGVKTFIRSEAFDHFVASATCAACLGISGYGVAVSAPLVYKHSRAFIAAVKPALAEAVDAAETLP